MLNTPLISLRRAGVSLLVLTGSLLLAATLGSSLVGARGGYQPSYSLEANHCYDKSKDEFRITITNTGSKATWRLDKSQSSAYLPNQSGVELGRNASQTYTTTKDGKWIKQVKINHSWKGKGDFTLRKHSSPLCVEEIPGCTDPEAINYNEQANKDDGSCKYKQKPTPTPTPTPTTSTKEDKKDDGENKSKAKGKHTSLSYETNCTDYTITASFHTTDNNKDVENVSVLFKYDGKEVKTTTNTSGYAYATFPYASSERELSAEGIGFGSQRANVQYICTGEVLGASTEMAYAATGKFADRTLLGLIAISTASIIAGAWLQIKQS